MTFSSIISGSTGVLFFDVLNAGFKRQDTQEDVDTTQRKQRMIENCVRLRDAADHHGIPIFYARPNHRPDGRDAALLYSDSLRKPGVDPEQARTEQFSRRINLAGQWGSEVIDEIKPRAQDYVVPKNRWNAFFQTPLELSMRTRAIDTIVLAGSATPVGIASTAYGARDRDFNLIIVRDACTGGTPTEHDLFMDSVFPRMARVRTTDEVIEMMVAGASSSGNQ